MLPFSLKSAYLVDEDCGMIVAEALVDEETETRLLVGGVLTATDEEEVNEPTLLLGIDNSEAVVVVGVAIERDEIEEAAALVRTVD
jgi:hypothetical protein